MVTAKTIFAYLAYAIVTMAVFLYLLFPEQAVKAYVDRRLALIDPSLTMEAGTIRPTLPPGFKLVDVDLMRDSVKLAHLDDAQMRPELTTLFREAKQGRFEVHVADGSIDGRATISGQGLETQVRAEANLNDVRLEQIDAVKRIERFNLSGRLSGRLTHEGILMPVGAINGAVNAAPLKITLATPVFGIAELIMNQTGAEFTINAQSLRLTALTFSGPMVEGRINGTIDLMRPLEKSRLNLNGNVKPQPELIARLQESVPAGMMNPATMGTRGMMLRLRGTVDNPDVSLR